MPVQHPLRTAAIALAMTAVTACAPTDEVASADSAAGEPAAPHEMRVVARDFAFEIPDTVPAGMTTIRLQNEGPDMHHFWIVKLAEGKTLDHLLAETRGDKLPDWAVSVGGPNTPVPGGVSQVTMDLEPGNYAALCVIPAPDGIPHVAKGMSSSFVVAPSDHRAPAPQPDIVLSLVDYDFQFSQPLTAGEHVIEVKTDAPQEHEVVMVRLAEGKTLNDFMTWMQKPNGPPPGAPVGGTVGLAPGRSNTLSVNLEPGEYALICFIPDHKDGRPHFMHGMMRQISVS
jgi:uncharacterized cupredoxin-like copper-binding protein